MPIPVRSPFVLILLLAFAAPSRAADDPKAVEFFETKIRPVLVEQCLKCHSDEAEKDKKLRGGLKLDSKPNWMKGGDTGPAIVPGKPGESSLIETLKYAGEVQMPPKGKLPANVVADFEKWIKDGAVDPRASSKAIAVVAGIDIEKGRQFWSFQKPIATPIPAISDPFIRNPLDAFILLKLNEKGLKPVGFADKRTLIRRASFDLTGLPPTPEEVAAFEKDTSRDAYEKMIDRLLASPRYGERWGRYWLDVARYAEDQAHTFGVKPKKNAYLYRDWVIKAFNSDMPFDTFVRLQIAGDMVNESEGDAFTRHAGLGFMGLGAEYYKNTAREQAIAEELDDRVDTLTRGFLGLTVSCARCHDHKFDPLPTRDYYSIAGIFNGTNMTDYPLAPADEVKAYTAAQNKLKAAEDKLKKMQADAKAKPADKELAAAAKDQMAEVEKCKKDMPPAPLAAHVLSGNGSGMKIYIRGNPSTKGDDAPKGFLQVLSKPGTEPAANYTRLELANDIASPDNPLSARVIVNRVWAWHFGRGLVNTPSNFGKLGDAPSHPELLDYLAVEFVKHGWSIKWLHRQIMTSNTYRLGSSVNSDDMKSDAANVYLWRGNRHRLDVESWRDSLLFVSGNLDETLGGPTFDLKDSNSKRRTVYAKVSRHELDGLLRLFDFPDANVTADKRTTTTVPQQQLFALNSDFMLTQAKGLAVRVEKIGKTDEERITAAYGLCFQRAPDDRELKLAVAFLKLPPRTDDKLTRWQQYCQVLLASNEFLYVD
jgi:hypothetical protein